MTKDLHGIEPDEALRAIDETPSIETFMSGLGKMAGLDDGWASISGTDQALQRQRADMARQVKAEANVFRDTFSTPAGRKCLAIMREMTIDAEPYPGHALLPLDAITPLMIAHDAQCRFVRAIFQAIAQAENTTAEKVTHERTEQPRRRPDARDHGKGQQRRVRASRRSSPPAGQ